MIRAILAHDTHWGIGKNGGLPWPKNSEDLQWFKECTTGSTIMMGRNTWESLPYKPLPNRINAIVTSQNLKGSLGCIVTDMDGMISILPALQEQRDIWVIGGAQLLERMLPHIDEMLLNNVGGHYNCDTFLPFEKIIKMFDRGDATVKSFGVITKWHKKC